MGEERHLVNDNHLSGLDVAHVLGLAQVQGTRLRGNAVAVGTVGAAAGELADAKRPEAVGIADGAHEVVGHEDAGKGPLGLGGSVEDLVELGVALRVRDEVQEELRVNGRLHQHTLILEEGLELLGV